MLKIGIVGLPNVGKSTLFNALLKKQAALAANYPFATIEPNVGIVEVPDKRLAKLAEVTKKEEGMDKLPPELPAIIKFVDIAGLVKGASKGEGLGNQFLAHIREVDLICHVLRAFEDKEVVVTGELDPVEDLKTVRAELILKDIETLEKHKENKQIVDKLMRFLNEGKMINSLDLTDEETELVKELCLITEKQEVMAVNLSEDQLAKTEKLDYYKRLEVDKKDLIYISAKMEESLSVLDDEDQKKYLKELGIKESGVDQMARLAYRKLNIVSFLTAGEKEVRAWTIKKGSTAQEAAGVIHTDFSDKFIKAMVVSFEDFVQTGGWKNCKERGKVRQEGKDYLVKDGDVIEYMVGS